LLKALRRLLLRLVVVGVLLTVGLTVPLRWIDPPGSAYMLADRVFRNQPVEFEWVPAERISPYMKLAVIAAEDQNFPHHRGFDAREIRAALDAHRQGSRLRGASTISQQLARNLYLWSGRNWVRKGLEMGLTVPLELSLSKARILEIYLNVVEFDTGVYGAEAAARHYFGKSALNLTREEAALLAATLPAPKLLDPANPSHYLLQRQGWILAQMNNLGPNWAP
jgi:monofunctional glycosyltransferase